MRLAVCVPTYNERENVEALVRALGAVFAEHRLDGRVLVVDDGSEDGTSEIADRMTAELDYAEVLHRAGRGGIGPAYLDGFRQVLADGAELVAEMDCDFSHNPADLPRLVEATADADIALGSRYVPGGGVRNWSRVRRIVSRAGCLYARVVLGIGVRDATGGFRVYRRHVLEALPFERVASKGYAFQVEMAYRAIRAGFTIREVPIVFVDRERGQSKMGPDIVLEAALRVPALRLAALRKRL